MLRELFAANQTANVTSFNTTRVCTGEGIFKEGNLCEGSIQEECSEELPGWEIFRKKRLGTSDRIPCRITSL